MRSKNVLNAPWLCDEKARLVKSNSSLLPHIVTTHKTNKRLYCCDNKCPMFAGFSICSHVVAVAECNGDLKSFLDAASATCAPNLSAIANQGLPRGAGKEVSLNVSGRLQYLFSRGQFIPVWLYGEINFHSPRAITAF